MTNDTRVALSITEHGTRVILSLGLITATVAGEGVLGMFAIVPLLAIYPGITNLIGRDPLTSLIGRFVRRYCGE